MANSTPVIVERPHTHIVGLSIVTSLREAEEKLTVKNMEEEFRTRAAEISNRVGTETYLVQVYPNEPFTHETRYKVIIGVKVEVLEKIPQGMIGHTLPAGPYAKVTHHGPESELYKTYDYINTWIPKSGRRNGGHDFEIWDERYKPESPDNVIDLHVAVR